MKNKAKQKKLWSALSCRKKVGCAQKKKIQKSKYA